MANNRMKFIRICTINFEQVAEPIDPPFYLDYGYQSSFVFTVTDTSGVTVTSYGTIFTGMTDWRFIDTNNIINYNMS